MPPAGALWLRDERADHPGHHRRGQAQQTRPSRSRSFVRGALHLELDGLSRSPGGRVDGRRDDQQAQLCASAVPHPCQNGRQTGVSRGHSQGTDLRPDLGSSRQEDTPERPSKQRVAAELLSDQADSPSTPYVLFMRGNLNGHCRFDNRIGWNAIKSRSFYNLRIPSSLVGEELGLL